MLAPEMSLAIVRAITIHWLALSSEQPLFIQAIQPQTAIMLFSQVQIRFISKRCHLTRLSASECFRRKLGCISSYRQVLFLWVQIFPDMDSLWIMSP
ncbi:hypothetical protein DL98DRAFT_52330 [Cadophora sp. DSE1049]|nr:hypothetical protein DL98DRAFT_52330 [Cadophora sp. DSE1049]